MRFIKQNRALIGSFFITYTVGVAVFLWILLPSIQMHWTVLSMVSIMLLFWVASFLVFYVSLKGNIASEAKKSSFFSKIVMSLRFFIGAGLAVVFLGILSIGAEYCFAGYLMKSCSKYYGDSFPILIYGRDNQQSRATLSLMSGDLTRSSGDGDALVNGEDDDTGLYLIYEASRYNVGDAIIRLCISHSKLDMPESWWLFTSFHHSFSGWVDLHEIVEVVNPDTGNGWAYTASANIELQRDDIDDAIQVPFKNRIYPEDPIELRLYIDDTNRLNVHVIKNEKVLALSHQILGEMKIRKELNIGLHLFHDNQLVHEEKISLLNSYAGIPLDSFSDIGTYNKIRVSVDLSPYPGVLSKDITPAKRQ